jgi:YfiH family protein
MNSIRPDWPAPANIHAFSTTRHGPGVSQAPYTAFNLGARCGDAPEAVLANRAALIKAYKLPAAPHWLQQVHGTEVVRVEYPLPSPLPQGEGSMLAERAGEVQHEPIADASVSAVANTVLAVLTADCLPVLFCNANGTEVAAAHAGWRGLAAGMLEATVAAMHSAPAELMAWLGPAAGPVHYEIDEPVRQIFLAADAQSHRAFIETRPGHYVINLPVIARQRLAAAGVQRVYGGEYCTLSDTRFYSHRREQQTGRMASLIWFS